MKKVNDAVESQTRNIKKFVKEYQIPREYMAFRTRLCITIEQDTLLAHGAVLSRALLNTSISNQEVTIMTYKTACAL